MYIKKNNFSGKEVELIISGWSSDSVAVIIRVDNILNEGINFSYGDSHCNIKGFIIRDRTSRLSFMII